MVLRRDQDVDHQGRGRSQLRYSSASGNEIPPDGMSPQSVKLTTYNGKAPWATTSELKNIKVDDAVETEETREIRHAMTNRILSCMF